VVKATAVKKSADENHGQGPPQATRVRARNNPKAPPENAGPQDGNTNKMSAACSPTSSSPPCLSGQIWTRACVGTILGTHVDELDVSYLKICNRKSGENAWLVMGYNGELCPRLRLKIHHRHQKIKVDQFENCRTVASPRHY